MGGNPSYLNSGSSLTPGEQLTSLDGTFSLVLEANGNLLVQGPGGATIWQPSLSGSPIAGSQLSLSTTAELTLGTESATVWSANTGCNQNPTVLSMDDDAILRIYAGSSPPGSPAPGIALWSTTPAQTPWLDQTPAQVATYYNFPNNQGEGVTIGILVPGYLGNIGIDTAQIIKNLNSKNPSAPTPNFQVVCISPQTNNQNSLSGEATMDASIIGTYVPAATAINIYLCEFDTLYEAINTAVNDGCSVTSCCFSVSEESMMSNISNALANAAAKNVTTCFASGDVGSSSDGNAWDAVEYPASDPNAVAVGGTFIPTGPPPQGNPCGATPLNAETVWRNWPYPATNFNRSWWSSGGGVSTTFSVPAYQTSINPTSYPVNGKTYTGRGVPDVAALAEGNNGWYGTSAATPTFASLIARINSALSTVFGAPTAVGNIHAKIYNPPQGLSPFKSITAGCNIPPIGQANAGYGYTAQKGWDACTGLGTPNGANLMATLSPASLTSATPDKGAWGQTVVVTLSGVNFPNLTVANVRIDAGAFVTATPTSASGTEVVANFVIKPGAPPFWRENVTVSWTVNQQTVATNPVQFTITPLL